MSDDLCKKAKELLTEKDDEIQRLKYQCSDLDDQVTDLDDQVTDLESSLTNNVPDHMNDQPATCRCSVCRMEMQIKVTVDSDDDLNIEVQPCKCKQVEVTPDQLKTQQNKLMSNTFEHSMTKTKATHEN